jgi:hypothetical protein
MQMQIIASEARITSETFNFSLWKPNKFCPFTFDISSLVLTPGNAEIHLYGIRGYYDTGKFLVVSVTNQESAYFVVYSERTNNHKRILVLDLKSREFAPYVIRSAERMGYTNRSGKKPVIRDFVATNRFRLEPFPCNWKER